MATFKFHLLIFCHLLYSETHSSEAQACWDSDKYYHLWFVTSTRLDYFHINSLPNLIPVNYLFTRAWCGSDAGDSLCWTPDVASFLGSNTCLRVRFPSPSSRTPFSYFSLTREKGHWNHWDGWVAFLFGGIMFRKIVHFQNSPQMVEITADFPMLFPGRGASLSLNRKNIKSTFPLSYRERLHERRERSTVPTG